MNKMNKKGFTLIEMLVVIAIIAVLVSIIVPVVSSSTDKAKAATDAANLRTIAAEAAIDYLDNDELNQAYTADCKSFPGAAVKIYKHNNTGEIQAVFEAAGEGATATSYGVAYFSKIAETGKKDNAPTFSATGYTAVTVKSSTTTNPDENK